jgi:hypothetical protein
MKYVASICAVFLTSTLAHASSKYAGEYYAVGQYSSAQHPAAVLMTGANIKVAGDGSLTGHGIYLDLTPVAFSGHVKDSGEVVLIWHVDGHQSKVDANFDSKGKTFFFALPNGYFVTGKKIPSTFPVAGVYHATTTLGERAILFVLRNGSVNGIIYHAGQRVDDVHGQATAEGFEAASSTGVTFNGKFDGAAISGAFSNGAESNGSFSGAKYQ